MVDRLDSHPVVAPPNVQGLQQALLSDNGLESTRRALGFPLSWPPKDAWDLAGCARFGRFANREKMPMISKGQVRPVRQCEQLILLADRIPAGDASNISMLQELLSRRHSDGSALGERVG
jgi:hypothetical protein